MATESSVRAIGDELADSQPMGWFARTGLAARGFVYLAMGWLAVLVAAGGKARIDQRGALTELLAQPMGTAMVIALAAGFAAYAIWRFSEAAFGVTDEDGIGPRVKSLFRGLAYAFLAFGSVSLMAGARATQSGEQAHLAGTVMEQTGGRWLVGAVGVIVAGVGVMMVVEGWSSAFMRYFGYLPQPRRTAVNWLGRIGTVARGCVFFAAGVLVVVAAYSARPAKAGGVDEAFRTLLEQPFGGFLVTVLGAGLIVFGVYGLAEALWRHVPDGPTP